MYIEELARERDGYLTAKKEAEAEVRKLEDLISTLRAELADSTLWISGIKAVVLEEAASAFSELESVYGDARTDIESTATNVRAELLRIENTVAKMSSMLEKADARLCGLRELVNSGKPGEDTAAEFSEAYKQPEEAAPGEIFKAVLADCDAMENFEPDLSDPTYIPAVDDDDDDGGDGFYCELDDDTGFYYDFNGGVK